MNPATIAAAATALAQAHRTGTPLEALATPPASIAEAHAIQDRVAQMLGEATGAFKANAPPGAETTRGLIPARLTRPGPTTLTRAECPQCGVEAEIAFRALRDFPAREAPYTRAEVTPHLSALPAIETVSSRFRDPATRPDLEKLADNIINAGLITGPETWAWAGIDFTRLRVTLAVNGETLIDQPGGHALGDPLPVALALINAMRTSTGVTAGQIITTGSWTGLRYLNPGDRCTISFEGLGGTEVRFSSR